MKPVCFMTWDVNNQPKTNHAALLVGYGIDADFGVFWVMQNSWGPNWGEGGLIRMVRNSIINCGIAAAASYPVGITVDGLPSRI